MPMSIYYMNVIHDIIASWVKLHEDDHIKFKAAQNHYKRKLGQLPYGNRIAKASKADYTEEQKEADRWLSNHAWPPPAPFKGILFPAKIWNWKKGSAAYAAHWRQEFLESKTIPDVRAAARAAAKGDFVKLGTNEYVRLDVRELTQLNIDDALRDNEDVADVELIKPLTAPTLKNVNADTRHEIMGTIVKRSLCAKAIIGLLQREVVLSRSALDRTKAKFRKRKHELKSVLRETLENLGAAEDDLAALRARAAALHNQVQQLKQIAPKAKLKKLGLADIGPDLSSESEEDEEEENAADNTEQQQQDDANDNVPDDLTINERADAALRHRDVLDFETPAYVREQRRARATRHKTRKHEFHYHLSDDEQICANKS